MAMTCSFCICYVDFHKGGIPVTLFGLFKNEQKMTLISAMIARMPGFMAPVKAKDPLVFQIGFRRFSTCPIFSEHAHQNKFKVSVTCNDDANFCDFFRNLDQTCLPI